MKRIQSPLTSLTALFQAPAIPLSGSEIQVSRPFNLVWDKSKEVDKALAKCEGSVLAIFEGIRAICHLYLAIDEPRSAWEVVADLMGKMNVAKLETAKDKARMLRVAPGTLWPEQFWVKAIEAIELGRAQAVEYAAAAKAPEEGPKALPAASIAAEGSSCWAGLAAAAPLSCPGAPAVFGFCSGGVGVLPSALLFFKTTTFGIGSEPDPFLDFSSEFMGAPFVSSNPF